MFSWACFVSRSLAVAGIVLGLFAANAAAADPIPKDAAPAEPQRMAIIIGNSDYAVTKAKLPNVAADAALMETLFRSQLNFDVVEPPISFKDLADFDRQIATALADVKPDSFVTIYYSGHGFSQGGHTYMVGLDFPDDVKLSSVPDYAIPVDSLAPMFWAKGAAFVLIIFDGCRAIAFDGLEGRDGISPARAAAEAVPTLGQYAVLFADISGATVASGATPGTPSRFTGLFDTVAADQKATLITDVFKTITTRAQTHMSPPTTPSYAPAPILSYVYFQKPLAIRDAEHRAWDGARQLEDPLLIQDYYTNNRLSAWAPEARAWLAKNPQGPSWSLASSESINAAWIEKSTGNQSVAVRSLGIPFGIERTVGALSSGDAAALHDLSLLPSGLRTSLRENREVIAQDQRAFDLFVLEKFGGSAVALGSSLAIQSAPLPDANVVLKQIPFGSSLQVDNIVKNDSGDWAKITCAICADVPVVGYTAIPKSRTPSPIELGVAFDTLTVSANPSFPAVIDGDAGLQAAIDHLKQRGMTFTWLYQEGAVDAPADAPDDVRKKKEWELRSRFADVAAAFAKSGIVVKGRTSSTILTDAPGNADGQITVKIFARAN